MMSDVDHPAHYGGADNLYEAVKVIEAWQLGFNLGNLVKYIARADHKGDRLTDLRKAAWYLNREIEALAVKPMSQRATQGSVKPMIAKMVAESDGLTTQEVTDRTGFKSNTVRGTLWVLGQEGSVVKRQERWYKLEKV